MITTSFTAGMNLFSARSSPKVGPRAPWVIASTTAITLASTGVPWAWQSVWCSWMRLRSVSSSTTDTSFSRPSPVKGLAVLDSAISFSATKGLAYQAASCVPLPVWPSRLRSEALSMPPALPPVPSVMASAVESAPATWSNSSAVQPAANIAAVIEPTEAPAIWSTVSSTPLSCRARTAPGSATPLPPPPEKVSSFTGGGGAV